MSHEHGGTGHTHEPHGGARGFGWDLLDSVMLGCAVVIGWLLAEQLWRAYRARREGVRFDLTDKGRAAAGGHTCTTTTTEALCAACKAEGSAWHRKHPEGQPETE